MDDDMDDEDRSALDYARHYKLCIPYDFGPVYQISLPILSSDDFDRDLWDPSHVDITNAATKLTGERLAVSREAALLLKSIFELRLEPTEDLLASDQYRCMLSLKQELPLLRTDNELDLLDFGSSATPDLNNLRLPFEATDQENDEGFEWPKKYFTYLAMCENKIKAERLAVSRDDLQQLRDAITDSYTAEDYQQTLEDNLQYEPHAASRPLTPPLLPLSPPLTPYIPSSPANRIPISSDSNSDTVEARNLEQQIMDADSLIQNLDCSDSLLLDITNTALSSPFSNPQASTSLKRKVEDLKVEGPLTPPILSDSPMKKLKSVTFSETLHQFIPDAPWAKIFSDDEDDLNDGSDFDFDEFFKDIAPYAKQARQRVENEKLSGADTTARVDVPDVEFPLPIPPWKEYGQRKGDRRRSGGTELEAQAKFLLRVKREDLKTATSWHGLSSLERTLPWGILTVKTAKINLDEQLHGETDFNKIQTDIKAGSIATSSSQVWKLEGLRILSEDEDENEIEQEEMEQHKDVDALIRKRKLEMEEEIPNIDHKRAIARLPPLSQRQSSRDMFGSHHWEDRKPTAYRPASTRSKTKNDEGSPAMVSRDIATQEPKATNNDLMFGGFSASSALHKFMETQGKIVGSAKTKTVNTNQHGRLNNTTTVPTLPDRSLEPSQDEVSAPSRSLPSLPAIPQHLAPCSFIISSAFLKQRSFLKQIEQLYQRAELIYRDYQQPHSPSEEADILLSPSTGLILTTLQQIKQQPLPGQPDRSVLKERLISLQLRCERLLVLISEGLSHEMESQGSSRPDDARDKEALARFDGFANQLEGEVTVRYVPGGERALACSIVVEMAKYGLPHGSQDIGDIKLMAAETTWEVFLRRLGINPFAAQVIIASLKTPLEVQAPDTSSSPAYGKETRALSLAGLAAFLVMGDEERVKFFQALMGGSRILRRVSRVLDQKWVSAAHGFRMG